MIIIIMVYYFPEAVTYLSKLVCLALGFFFRKHSCPADTLGLSAEIKAFC